MTEVKRENAVKIEGRQYIVVSPDLGNDWAVGTILTLSEDDGTNLPWFTDKSGNGGYMYMHEVMLLAETVEKVEEPVKPKLPEHKYAVGKKLTVNGNTDIWNCYSTGTEVEVKSLEGHWGENRIPRYNVISKYDGTQLVHEGQLEPVAPHITEEQYATLEVGDTIVIRGDLEIGSYGKNSVTDGMLQEKGKQLTVKSNVAHTLGLRVEESPYNWTQQMIAEVIKKEIITEKPEFIPEIGQIYATDSMILKVNSISENKIYGAGLYSMMGYQLREEGDSSWSANANRTTPLTPATDEQKIKLLTAIAEHGDATDSDLDLLSELMPLDNPEMEVGEVYMVQAREKWLVRKDARSLTEMTLCFAMTPADKYVDTMEGHLTGRNYRKALPHEVVKLETAEKEHGCEYKKPLINSKGTVIEVGKYYTENEISDGIKSVSLITDISKDNSSFTEHFINLHPQYFHNEKSMRRNAFEKYVQHLVPATQEEIAEFKAAELRSEIKVGQTYRVEMPTSDNSVFELTITGKDAKNFNVTYEGISGKNVSDNISQDSAIWKDAELVE